MPGATTTTWTGGAGNTDFNDPSNWSAGVPSSGTDAVISGSSAAPLTVSLAQGTDAARTLHTKFATLDLSGGALTVGGASTLDALDQSGGLLRFENSAPGARQSSFTGSLTQTAGTLQVDAGSLDLLGTSAVGGTVTGGGTVVNAGALAADGLTAGADAVLENQGTVTLANGVLHLGDGKTSAAALLNDAGGLFNIKGHGSIEGGAAFGRPDVSIVNAGLFEKSGGTTVSAIYAPFTNTGEVMASSGTLAFLSVNSYAGSIDGAGTVAFDAPTNTLAPGVELTVAAVALGGTLVLGTDVGYDGVLLAFGHVLDTGTNTLTLNNAADNLQGAAITGGGALSNDNKLALDGVTIGGSVRFDNAATATLAGGLLALGDGQGSTATLAIRTGAVFDITDDGDILNGPRFDAPNTSISNDGLFEKTGGVDSTIYTAFGNTGTVLANSGALRFADSTVLGGTIDGSGTVALDGARNTLAAGAVVTVATVALGGSLVFEVDLTDTGVLLAGGQTLGLNGHTLMLDNSLDDIDGASAVGGGNLMNCDTLSVNDVTIGDSVVLANEGTISLGDHPLMLGDSAASTASFVNDSDATFEMLGGGSIEAGGTDVSVVNDGLFHAGGGRSAVFAPFTNAGSVWVTAGALTLHAVNDLAGGVLGGGTWDSAGTIAFAAGGAVRTDAATIILEGPNAAFLSAPGGVPVALETTLTSIAAGGVLLLVNGRAFATGSAISDAGVIGLADGTVSAAPLTVEAGGTLIGFGAVLAGVTGGGLIEASGGNLVLHGGSGSAVIDAGASLELAAPFTGDVTLAANGAPGLALDAPDDLSGTIDGLANGDTLDFKNVLVTGAALVGKTLRVTVGATTRTYDLGAALAGSGIVINPDASGTGSNLVVASVSFAPAVALVNTSSPIDVGKQRVGSGAQEVLSITNAATPLAEGLDATISASGSAIAGGTITLLPAGQTDVTHLTAGLFSGTPGIVTGSAVLAFFSDGAATSGNAPQALPSQTLALTGTYYALAAAAFSTPSIVHAGGSGTIHLAVQNVATPSAFAEGLRAAVAGASGALSAGGTTGLIAAGSTDASSLALIIPTVAGIVSGAVTVDLHSDGAGTSGFGPLHIGDPTIDVTVTVDNFATATIEKTGGAGGNLVANGNTLTLDFGTLAAGSAAVTVDLDVRNAAGGPADLLSGAFGAGYQGTEFTNTGFGTFSGLAAGTAGDASSITFTPDALGLFSETIVLSPLGSNASGFAGKLPHETLVVTGMVSPGLAQPLVNTGSPIDFGNVRIGTPLRQPLSITNAATPPAQSLDATATSSGEVSASGSIDRLAAGATDTTSLVATLDTGIAGVVQGAVALAFSSDDGSGTITPLSGANATIDLGGTVYAEASFAAITPAPVIVHVGDAGTGLIAVQNIAVAPYAENLLANVAGAGGGVTVDFEATRPLAPQSSSNFAYTIDTANAAVINGTVTLDFATDGTGIDNAAPTAIGTRTIAVAATVDNFATAVLRATAGTLTQTGNNYVLDLGTVATGSSLQTVDLLVANGASGPADVLSGTLTRIGGTGFIDSGAGSFATLAAGASADVEQLTLDPATAGNFSETFSLQSSGSNASGYSAALAGATVTVEATVEQPPAIFATVLGVGGSTVTIPFATTTNAAAAQITLNSISDQVRAGTLTQLAFDAPPAVTGPLVGLVELNSSTVPLPDLALSNNSVAAVVDGASQQVVMTGLPGHTTVVSGRGGAIIGNAGPGNEIFFGGGGNQQFVEVDLAPIGVVSSADVWLDGDATFDDSAGNTLIHIGTVTGGAGAVATKLLVKNNGAGTTTIDIASDPTGTAASDFIAFDGTGSAATTVNAAGGADSLGAATGGVPLSAYIGTGSGFINGNGSNVTLFGGGTGAVTLLGGAGADTVDGAAGLIEAGTAGGSRLLGSTLPGVTTLIGGGAGDQLSSFAANTVMIAGVGNETLTAFAPSTLRGAGAAPAPGAVPMSQAPPALTLFQGQTGGNTYLPGDGQTSISSVVDANGGNLFQESVSGSTNTATIGGFVSGMDSISGVNPAGGAYALVTDRAPGAQEMSLAVNGSTSTVTFGDGTTWIFSSVVRVGDFVNVAAQGGV